MQHVPPGRACAQAVDDHVVGFGQRGPIPPRPILFFELHQAPTLRPFGITFEAANPSVLPHWTAVGCCVDLADPTRKIPIVLALALLTISRGAQRGANDHTHEATPGHTQPLRLQLNGSSSYT